MPVLLAVGTNKGVFFYRSDEARKAWTISPPQLAGWDVYSLYRDSRGRVYAGTNHFAYGATVRTTDNLGETWEQQEARPAYAKETGWELKRLWQLVGHPTEPDTLYAGVEDAGLFVSRDRGTSWSEIEGLTRRPGRAKWNPGGGGLCLHTILINPKNPSEMWVGISAVGIFRTRDGGATWTNHNATLPQLATGSDEGESACCVHKIVLDPTTPTRLFMQYHGGVLVSNDSGEHWTAIESGLPGNFGFPMVITHRGELFVIPLKADTERFFNEQQMRLYRSKNAGQSWQPVGQGLPTGPNFSSVLRDAMAVDPLPTPGVYLGTTGGEVYASADAGESWQRLPGTLPRISCVRAYVEKN